jgi:hypothetical protein
MLRLEKLNSNENSGVQKVQNQNNCAEFQPDFPTKAANVSSFSMPGKRLGLGLEDPPFSTQNLVQAWQQEGGVITYMPMCRCWIYP